jgi:hypothetical protein
MSGYAVDDNRFSYSNLSAKMSELGPTPAQRFGHFTPYARSALLAGIRHDRGTRELMSRATDAGRLDSDAQGVGTQHI